MKSLIKATRELLAPSREVIPLIAVGPRIHYKHEDVVDAEVVKDWSVWVKWIKALMVVTLGIIIGFHVVDLIDFMKGMRPPEQHQIAVQPEATVEENVAPPALALVGRHGVLSWDKPDGYGGLNPKIRGLELSVVVDRDDKDVMDITVEDGTHIHWNKNSECGDWSKAGGGSGKWCMKPDEDGGNAFFSGYFTDNLNVRYPATLSFEEE